MIKLSKYKYYIIAFIVLELFLIATLSELKENKIQTHIDKQSSIIITNYSTIYAICKKISNENLTTSDRFEQLKIEMEKFLDINVVFLIHNKNITSAKTNYILSNENPYYFYDKRFFKDKKKFPFLIEKYDVKQLKTIENNLNENKNFSIYNFDTIPKIATFISLESLKDNGEISYLVAYQDGSYLKEIRFTYIIFLLVTTIASFLLILFIYKSRNARKLLETKVSRKTKQLKELNESLENTVEHRTKEQATLLSLFDKGDSVLFKWKNDEIWSVDHVSKSVEKFLGYSPEEFLKKEVQYAHIIHKDDIVRVINEVSSAIESSADFFIHQPYRVITKSGKAKWVKDYTVSVRNHRGEIINFVGYISDISVEINHQIELENEVKEKTKTLKELNENLEKQIETEILKNTEKEKLIFQQSKMACMGEMLGNIAHQWKQPLNSISISASSMQLQKELGTLDDEIFQYGVDGIIESTDFLSQTIDDFQNFLKPNNKVIEFDLKDSIEKSLQLVAATFKKNSVTTILDIPSVTIKGIQGEFTQVILNILNNAKDILIERNKSNNRIIYIESISLENKVLISIKDNAGGIPEDIIKDIFDQYFTTKDTEGTGIGLHMSKEIIESHMNGKLEVKNDHFTIDQDSYTGANFTITLPIEKKED